MRQREGQEVKVRRIDDNAPNCKCPDTDPQSLTMLRRLDHSDAFTLHAGRVHASLRRSEPSTSASHNLQRGGLTQVACLQAGKAFLLERQGILVVGTQVASCGMSARSR